MTHQEMIPGFKMGDVPWTKAPAPRVAPAMAVRETLQSQVAGEPKAEAKDTKPRSEVRRSTHWLGLEEVFSDHLQETLVYQTNESRWYSFYVL